MSKTTNLRENPTKHFVGNFVIERHLLNGAMLLAVNELKPEMGVWSSNCYILHSGDYAVVIDPGLTYIDDVEKVLELCEGLKKTDVLLTHGHFDHLYAASRMLRHGNIHIHRRDAEYINRLSVTPSENEQIAFDLAVIDFPPRLKYDFTRYEEDLKAFKSKKKFLDESDGLVELPIRVEYVNDGGHTLGHTFYVFKNIAFIGDAFSYQQDKVRWAIDFMFGKGEGPQERNARQIRKDCKQTLDLLVSEGLGIEYVAPGHTEPDKGKLVPIEEFRKLVRGVIE